MIKNTDKLGWVRIDCDGGCGRHVVLRAKKVRPHDFYLCDSKASGQQCKDRLPPCIPGQIRVLEFNAAAHFMGISYQWPKPDEIEILERAENNMAMALACMTIKKAKEV